MDTEKALIRAVASDFDVDPLTDPLLRLVDLLLERGQANRAEFVRFLEGSRWSVKSPNRQWNFCHSLYVRVGWPISAVWRQPRQKLQWKWVVGLHGVGEEISCIEAKRTALLYLLTTGGTDREPVEALYK